MEIFDGKGVCSPGVQDPEKRRSKESRADDSGHDAGCVDIHVSAIDYRQVNAAGSAPATPIAPAVPAAPSRTRMIDHSIFAGTLSALPASLIHILRRKRAGRDEIIENDDLLQTAGRELRHRRELKGDGRRAFTTRTGWLRCRWMASRDA